MQKRCCKAMIEATDYGYLDWPISYVGRNQVQRSTPIIIHRLKHRKAALEINFCPWCGKPLKDE